MTYVAILILILVAFTVVGWPLISSSRTTRREADEGSPWDDLISQRDVAYQAIKDLDFEYELGNLSESDYRDLRERYRGQAAAILQKLDAAMGGAGLSEAPASGGAASTAVAPTLSRPADLTCPACSQPTEPADGYCWSCGAQLGRRCPGCGGSVQASDRFCVGCGALLEAEA